MKKASCRPTKNPCKICFQSVTKKTGIQCCGACQKWVHFNCVNYTPGKVRDIKKGIIRIMCPCPDCSSEPKEILVNPPYTCANQKCPANNVPKCEDKNCPVNTGGMLCSKDQCSKSVIQENYAALAMNENNPPHQGDSSYRSSLQYGPPQQYPPHHSSMQYGSPHHSPQQYDHSQCFSPPHGPPKYGPPPGSPSYSGRPQCRPVSPSDSYQKVNVKETCPGDPCISGHLLTEINLRQIQPTGSNSSLKHAGNYKSQSCVCVSKAAGTGTTQICLPPIAPVKQSLSDSRCYLGKNNLNDHNRHSGSMETALEQMCNTVGILTHQIRDLMCKIMDKHR